jgi:hypothetical protein
MPAVSCGTPYLADNRMQPSGGIVPVTAGHDRTKSHSAYAILRDTSFSTGTNGNSDSCSNPHSGITHCDA